MEKSFIRQLIDALSPPENRLVAAVSFWRTFWQAINGTSITAAGGGITLTAVGLAEVNWTTVLLALAAVSIASLGSALKAYFNVLTNGISPKYAEAIAITEQRQADSVG